MLKRSRKQRHALGLGFVAYDSKFLCILAAQCRNLGNEHDIYIKIGVASILFLSATRICSPDFLEKEFELIREQLLSLKYPDHIIEKAIHKANKLNTITHFSSVLQKCGCDHSGEKSVHKTTTKDCKPTDACACNGGYCIENRKKGDCDGLLFPNECITPLCSCCVKAPTVKLDECAAGNDTCPANSKCQDKEIGYECACNAGFEQCGDINECDNDPCGLNSQCQNTPGSYECVCDAGYEAVNGTCADLNECDSNLCGPDGVCSNSPGSFSCNCNAGYAFSGASCMDLDECLCNPCPNGSVCANTPGSYLCQCPPGYNWTKGACVDIDDCASATCSDRQYCRDKLLGYDCICKACAEQCQYGATFVKKFGNCYKLISGNMTFPEANRRCSDDFLALAIIRLDADIPTMTSYFLSGISEMAWTRRSLSYQGSLQGSCFGVTSTSSSPGAKSLPCDSRLKYAICLAKTYY
ncbi:fibrillin-1-like [Macrobrachium nipponense]|uniref:fibrillin-1-like n=1 Tax=Macrobrachium nipponense TaxID=159736 RepID=UPI0030C8A7B5